MYVDLKHIRDLGCPELPLSIVEKVNVLEKQNMS